MSLSEHPHKPKIEKSTDIVDAPPVAVEKSVETEHDALKILIEKNIKWSQVIYNQNRKIQRRLTWMTIGSYTRLFLILIPLILGIIYLPPIISDAWAQYGSQLGSGNAQSFQDYINLFKSN